jgi:hypothetical protein
MRRKTIVSSVLVPLGCLVILLTTCSPSFAQLGSRLLGSAARRDRLDDPPPPKPPAPPLGVTIHPPQPAKPLPEPIPAPPVPKLGETSNRPSQEQPAVETPEAQSRPRPELSPEMAALRDGVRRTLLSYYSRPLSTQTNTPGDLMHFCMAYGRNAEVRTETTSTKMVNGIGALCWNYPCGGRYLINSDGEQFVPRIGYGLQSRHSEFLAMLAMTGVSPEYEIRVSEASGTVADLVRREQLDIRSGNDLSFTAIGLAYYLPDGATWQNSLGESWSLDRLAEEELDREVAPTGPAAVDRLIGLACFVDRGRNLGSPLSGRFAQIGQYLDSFHDHALKLQNDDGTWNPYFFGYRGTSRDAGGTLRSTGHILEWLVMSLPEDRLQSPQVLKAVAQVNSILAGQSSRLNVSSMSPQDIATYMRALHALSIYNQRVFKPCDPPPETEEEKAEVASAGR